MIHLVRFVESGRESQPERGKTQRDIAAVVCARLPGASIRSAMGRLFVDAPAGAAEVLRSIHGISSFSPCRHCRVRDLEPTVTSLAAEALRGHRRFRVQVKRVGRHDFTSLQMAAELGARVQAEIPHAIVDLTAPEVVIGVEIRDDDCYVFDRVIPGLDHAGKAPAAALGARGMARNPPRFLVDHMLGRLVTWLRLLGYDTLYARDEADSALLRRARREQRILLTRDHALSRARSALTLFVEARTPEEQLTEVARSLALRFDRKRMFTRCSQCNQPVRSVAREHVQGRLPAAVNELYDELTVCVACDKIYWKGGQYQRILARLAPLFDDRPEDAAPDRA